MAQPVYMTGLRTKAEANQRAKIFKDQGWTTEVIAESNGTFTVKATPPAG